MAEKYHRRWLESWILKAAKEEPVIIVTGARQVGKSTLLKHAFPDWAYHNLDDFDTFDRAGREPQSLLAETPVIIDEAQREPRLFQAVKQAVDRSGRGCRIILSGSANMLLMKGVTESLAGRAVVCELRPFAWGERYDRARFQTLDMLFDGKMPKAHEAHGDIVDAIPTGFMPIVMAERKAESAWRWLEGYVTSYLERDLRQLSQIDALSDFRRLMQALAQRSGQIINQTEIGRDVSLKQPTVHRYINILEASLLAERLPAYAVSRTKRLIKAPKIYFMDSGLAAYLAGATEGAKEERIWGALVETAVLHHLRAWSGLFTPKAQVHYWRTASGAEVDFVIERGQGLVALEVKATARPSLRDADALMGFLEEYPRAKAAALVHMGKELSQLADRIFAVPFSMLV
jgi:predicted AAA+ superfamily ATPase